MNEDLDKMTILLGVLLAGALAVVIWRYWQPFWSGLYTNVENPLFSRTSMGLYNASQSKVGAVAVISNAINKAIEPIMAQISGTTWNLQSGKFATLPQANSGVAPDFSGIPVQIGVGQ